MNHDERPNQRFIGSLSKRLAFKFFMILFAQALQQSLDIVAINSRQNLYYIIGHMKYDAIFHNPIQELPTKRKIRFK